MKHLKLKLNVKKGDKTVAEYKEYYKKGYEIDIDSISIKNNEIAFTINNDKSIKDKYQYLGYYIQ
jgi:Zn/Cd-binding protein ZinT